MNQNYNSDDAVIGTPQWNQFVGPDAVLPLLFDNPYCEFLCPKLLKLIALLAHPFILTSHDLCLHYTNLLGLTLISRSCQLCSGCHPAKCRSVARESQYRVEATCKIYRTERARLDQPDCLPSNVQLASTCTRHDPRRKVLTGARSGHKGPADFWRHDNQSFRRLTEYPDRAARPAIQTSPQHLTTTELFTGIPIRKTRTKKQA